MEEVTEDKNLIEFFLGQLWQLFSIFKKLHLASGSSWHGSFYEKSVRLFFDAEDIDHCKGLSSPLHKPSKEKYIFWASKVSDFTTFVCVKF